MSQNPDPEPQNGAGLPRTASNPLLNGSTGKMSVYLLVAAVVMFTVVVAADTIQYVATGHESTLLAVIARDLGGVSLLSVATTLLSSYLRGRG